MIELISIFIWAVYTYVTYLVTVFSVSVYVDPDQIDQLLPDAKESHRNLLKYLAETPLAFTHAANLFKWFSFPLVAAASFIIGPDLTIVSNLPNYLSFGIVLFILTAITFMVIEILPRRKSLQRLDARFFRLVPALRIVFTLSKAYLRFQQKALARQGSSSRLSSELKEEIVERAIESLADQVGASEKLIAEAEGEMIEGVFQLSSMEAQEIMTPRVDLVGLELNATLAEIRKTARKFGHSRYPVYKESLDKIVGTLYIKDIFINPPTDPEKFSIADYMREPYFVPSRIKTSELFKDLKAKKVHAAIVVDEFGGAAGFVTLEDILEEIVGDIQDEHDIEEPEFIETGDHTYEIDAGLPLKELAERLNLEHKSEEFETVAGLIYDLVGSVPEQGERIKWRGLIFTVKKLDGQRIERVEILDRNR